LRKTATPPEETPDDNLEADPEANPEADPHVGPLRRCLVTRETLPRGEMLRFVLGPGNEVVFDVTATLPGRGMWLSASGIVLDMAAKRGVFPRAAKTQVKLPADLRSVVTDRLRGRIFDLLGLARRSGAAISGFEKAREWLVSGKAALVVQAVDGSAEERARFIGAKPVPVVAVLDATRLGQVFGRDHAVHVAVAGGRLAEMIALEAARLAGVGTSVQ